MHPSKFGDSYDIVKQSFLRWLKPCGTWVAHPMFTVGVTARQEKDFSNFLGVSLVTTDTVPLKPQRDTFFETARACQDHLFLDPDTGLRLPKSRVTRKHLMAGELLCIAKARPDRLTLVYDQSIDRRSSPEEQLEGKLLWLAAKGVYGLAYLSTCVSSLYLRTNRSLTPHTHSSRRGNSLDLAWC